jgi:hypothetical protein
MRFGRSLRTRRLLVRERMAADGSITHEELKLRLAIRMVGAMAIRGESRAAILAEYPHLHDDDIELARSLAVAIR